MPTRGDGEEDRLGFFERKPLAEIVRDTEASTYKRTLGPWALIGLGVSAIIGAGIFVLTGQAAEMAGPAVLVSYLIAGTACIFAALAYAELASMIPSSGSAYTYAFASMGQFPAFLMAWLLILEYAVGNMVVAIGWSDNLTSALDRFGLVLPDALRAAPSQGGLFDLPAFLIVMLVTGLVVIGIRESAGVSNTLTLFKIFVVVAFIAVGLFFIRGDNYGEFSPGGVTGVGSAAALVFFAYIGFDAVSATSEEAKNPTRDVPIGILGSLLVCMVLYALVVVVLTGIVPVGGLDSEAPLARAFDDKIAGASELVSLGALVATTTVLLAFSIGLPRIFQAVARDGLMPDWFARISPRFGTPVALTVGAGIIVGIGAAVVPLTDVADLTIIGTLFIYVLVSVGVLVLKKTDPEAPRGFRTHAVFPLLGILACGGLLLFVRNPLVWLAFLVWMGAGLIVYGFYGHRRALRKRNGGDSPEA